MWLYVKVLFEHGYMLKLKSANMFLCSIISDVNIVMGGWTATAQVCAFIRFLDHSRHTFSVVRFFLYVNSVKVK